MKKQLTKSAFVLLVLSPFVLSTFSSCKEEIALICLWVASFDGDPVTFDECSASLEAGFTFFGGFSSDGNQNINVFDFELEEGVQTIGSTSNEGLSASLFMNGNSYSATGGTFEFTEINMGEDTSTNARMTFIFEDSTGLEMEFNATAEGVLFNK
jgi:hypothetical protein